MDCIEVRTLRGPLDAEVDIPGSKSYTNRALIMAALADGTSRIRAALDSEDTEHMQTGLRALGIEVQSVAEATTNLREFVVHGRGGEIPVSSARLFVGNAGTVMRFLTSMVALGHGDFELDGIARMRERPIEELLDGLAQLGVTARSKFNNGCPPVIVEARGIPGGMARMKGNVSSQYFSSILLAAPYAQRDVEIAVQGRLVARPFLDMTAAIMQAFGVMMEIHDYRRFRVSAGQRYVARDYRVEPDASSASYFFAAAAVTGGRVRVRDLPVASAQGDLRFTRILEAMGCRVKATSDSIEVTGPAQLHGLNLAMTDLPDMVPTLAAIAPFADSAVTIRGVEFVRYHETDRLHALATELQRLGCEVTELPDGLVIHPSALHGAELETYNDHRIAMAFAVTGLRVPRIRLRNPQCVAKTFPDFFVKLQAITTA